MLVRAAETISAEPWRDEWWTTAESVTDALTHSKSVSGKRSRCPIMTTHVDDCDLDGAKALRTLVWESRANIICRQKFIASADFLRLPWAEPGSVLPRVVVCVSPRAMTQRRSWRTAAKLGVGPIRVCTTAGQSRTPSDPKVLPEQQWDAGARAHWEFAVSGWSEWVRKRKSGTFLVLSRTQLNGLSS